MLYPNPQRFDHLRCFFVHCPKAAGTSIERTLAAPNQTVGGHSTAGSMRRKWPSEWENYFTFSVVRHPMDRFLSAYSYLRQEPVHPAHNNTLLHKLDTLDAFLDRLEAEPDLIYKMVHMIPQSRFLQGLSGEILVEKVYRFEEMEDAWKDICARLGVVKPLPHLNASKRVKSEGKVERLVRKLYEGDFKLFNYQ